MQAWQAGEIAAGWTAAHAGDYPGLLGAYLSGSYLGADRESPWPESSDVDLVLVFAQGQCPPKLGKFREQGLLLEVTCLEEGALSGLEQVLSTHYLAYALNAGAILFDPSGALGRLHRQVKGQYSQARWVEARCQSFFQRIQESAAGWDRGASLARQVNGWAFTAGLTCFPILCAALENCTVRKRFSAARQALERYGLEGFAPRLTGLLAPKPLGRDRLGGHLDRLEETFALACASKGPSSSYAFRADISPEGAAVALGGSRELAASPWPEEALFWMLATFARCHIILELDNPALEQVRRPALWALLRDLGIEREEDFLPRVQAVVDFLPEVEHTARLLVRRRKEEERGMKI